MQNYLFAIIINGALIFAWCILYIQNPQKAKLAMITGAKTVLEMLPLIVIIIGLLGIFSNFISPDKISLYLGDRSGILGFFFISICSSFLQIPGIIIFPIAATLWHGGAAVATVAVFASASTMASILTIPLEMKYLGRKLPIIRIVLTYGICVAVALFTGFFYRMLI